MLKKRIVFFCLLLYISLTKSVYSLSAPQSLVATAGNKQIEIYWSEISEASSYELYRSTKPDTGFSLIASALIPPFLDSSVSNNTTYYYYMKTYDGISYSEPSKIIHASPHYSGKLAFYRWSDWIFYFDPWILETNGTLSDSAPEQEIHLSEGQDNLYYSSAPSPQITSDKKWIVFAENGAIKKYNLVNHSISIIVPKNVEQEQAIALSPDDTTIAYVKKNGGKNSLYLIDFDGSNERILLSDGFNNRYPDFSPDMQTIVFVTNRFILDELETINITSLAVTRITNNTLQEKYPRYSHDGSKIAFYAFDSISSSNEIYTIDTNGSDLQNITGGTSNYEYFPTWSPDDTKLAYIFRVDEIINQQTFLYFHIKTIASNGSGAATFLTNSAYKIIRAGLDWQGKTDVMPPRPIIDLISNSADAQTITLSFTAPGDDGSQNQAESYQVLYSENIITPKNCTSAPVRKINELPSSPNSLDSIILDHLKANTTYYIAVKTLDDQSNISDIYNVITVNTTTSTDGVSPEPPSEFTATANDFLRIRLTWTHSPSTDVAGYSIYRNSIKIDDVPYITTYTDVVSIAGISVQYEIRAIDENMNESTGIMSKTIISFDNTIPPPPQWLRIYNFTDRVQLKWQSVAVPDITGYKVFRTLNNVSTLIATTGKTNFYEDTTGTLNLTYNYHVTAIDTAGNESLASATEQGTKGLPDNKRIIVVVNQNSLDSIEIGEYYKTVRNIPSANILYVNMPTTYKTSRSIYIDNLHTPILTYINNNNLNNIIRYIVLCKDIPVWVDSRSVSTLLADIYHVPTLEETLPDSTFISSNPHPYYLSKKRFSNDYAMLLTARLDGPTVSIVKSIIDNSLYMENHSDLINQGIMWIDNRNVKPNLYSGFSAQAERYIETSLLPAQQNNISFEHDTNSSIFPLGTLTDTQYFYGWYSFWNFKEIFNGFLRPGSIAGHLGSASFYSIQNTGDNNWGIHLIERGASAAYGSIVEPFTFAFPIGGIMYDRLYKGFNLAESYWTATNTMRWRMILIGDPLYNPFALSSTIDSTAPVVSNITAQPAGILSYAITWQSDEPTEHAVDYFIDNDSFKTTGYLGWFSRDAHVVLSNLIVGKTYTFVVKSRDISGNETISATNQFTYTDSDNDSLEDSWETIHFSSTTLYDGTDDPDNDAIKNVCELDRGSSPNTHDYLVVDTSNNMTKISWNTYSNRIYRIYFDDTVDNDINDWTQAGPYRLGTGASITWTDDGRNTSTVPEDPAITYRSYRITSTPLSR